MLRREKVHYGTLYERDQLVSAFRRNRAFHPRNPQQQSITGQAQDDQAKGNTMRFIPSIRSMLFALVMLAMSAAAFAQFGVSITIGPPALPVYEQPPVPAQGYLWAPGYWAYGPDGYFFVPGTWVMAPQPGYLWTPGYWGWNGGAFAFNEGYWGPHVGFYGGINYGFGYGGQGYEGGRWNNGQFEYNTAVNNVNVTNIHNTYNTTVINNTTVNRVSYNGGSGGITAAPTAQDQTYAHEKHIAPVAAQTQQLATARANPQQRASVNHGKPAIAATPKPGSFSGGIPAKEAGAPYKPEVKAAAAQPPAKTPAARPENNVPRPGTPAPSTPAARNEVPRPPSTPEKATAAKPETTPRPAASAAKPENTPRPEVAKATPPKPEEAPAKAAPREAAPRPENTPHPEAAAKPEAHPEAAPRAEARPATKPEKEAAPEERREQQ
jgi:hypothetical protein